MGAELPVGVPAGTDADGALATGAGVEATGVVALRKGAEDTPIGGGTTKLALGALLGLLAMGAADVTGAAEVVGTTTGAELAGAELAGAELEKVSVLRFFRVESTLEGTMLGK